MYQSDNVVDKYYECDSHVGCSGAFKCSASNTILPETFFIKSLGKAVFPIKWSEILKCTQYNGKVIVMLHHVTSSLMHRLRLSLPPQVSHGNTPFPSHA